MLTSLLPIVLAPVIGAVIALIVARVGYDSRIKKVEYHVKRLELIRTLLDMENHILDSDIRQQLGLEVVEVAGYVSETSPKLEVARTLDHEKLPAFRRLLILPAPQSVTGWIWTLIYYVYFFGAILYFIIILFIDVVPVEAGLVGLVSNAVLSQFGRYMALRGARKAVLLARTKPASDLSQRREAN